MSSNPSRGEYKSFLSQAEYHSALSARPPEQVYQDRFGLVVGMVGQGTRLAPSPAAASGKSHSALPLLPAGLTGRYFSGMPAH
jgi:hypothetical protein